jgi:hypothetical protein
MDHSPWLVARMCSSISRMSSKEDVLVVPPCRCRYFYGLTKAVAHLAYLVFSDILPTEMDRKDKYGFACGWAAGYRSSWLYRYGTLVDRKDKRHSICCTVNRVLPNLRAWGSILCPLYLIPFPTFLLICMASVVATLNFTLIRFDTCNKMKWIHETESFD